MSDNQELPGRTSLISEKEELARQVVAEPVYLCKENILQQALKRLSLKIQESKACTVGNDQIIGSICIDAPSHGQFSMLHNKKIFGDYKLTEEDALESASLATLLYLQKIGIIFIDDVNQSNVAECEAKLANCQWKLLAASDWATMFQEKAESLKAKLDIAYKENERLTEITKSFHVKKEPDTSETADDKEGLLALQMLHTTKEAWTPPPFDHKTDDRVLQYEKRSALPRTSVKRSLFKTEPADDCKPQKCAGVGLVAPFDAHDAPLLFKEVAKEETTDLFPCLIPQTTPEGVFASRINQVYKKACKTLFGPIMQPVRLPCSKPKSQILIALPSSEHAATNRKKRRLVIDSNRLKSKGSIPVASAVMFSVAKGAAPSAIRTTLFQDMPATEGVKEPAELSPHVEPEVGLPKVGAPDSPPVLASEATKEKASTRCRQQKVQSDTTPKKPKP